MEQVLEKIARLNDIGIALSAAKDINTICDEILAGAMELTNADGGSLYRISDDKSTLKFVIVATKSLGIHMGGTSEKAVNFPDIPLEAKDKPNKTNVVSFAVIEQTTINIPDVYHAQGFDFSGTRKFDQQTNYKTQSILTIPLKDHHHEIIGVLQLINAKDETTQEICEFTAADQQLAESLASQAAVAITNNTLIEKHRELFEAFIKVMADAIDEKSPYTGSHCKRVPELTMMIAEACHNANRGPLKDFKMSERDRYELTIAGWLHDCGKITTPEYVINKSTKLETIYDRINLVDTRFEILKRNEETLCLKEKLKRLNIDNKKFIDLDNELENKIEQLTKERDFIRNANTGGETMSEESQQKIRKIAEHQWVNDEGKVTPLLNAEEVKNLTIEKGTLTDDEREIINNHMSVTIKMLEAIPFPEHLSNVPEYAGGHHERMDGKGFPKGLTREQLSLQARMMGIADIFEALSASDRPYKPGKPLTECLAILGELKKRQHIDPDIFDVFVRDKVYQRYAESFLPRQQIDDVDHNQIPGFSG